MERAIEDAGERRRVGAPKRARAVRITKAGAAKLRAALHARWEADATGTRSRPTRAGTAELLGVSPKTSDRIFAGQGVDRNTLVYAFRSLGLEWDDAYCHSLASDQDDPISNRPSGSAIAETIASPEVDASTEAQAGGAQSARSRKRGAKFTLAVAAAVVLLSLAIRPARQGAALLSGALSRENIEGQNWRASSAATAEFQAGNYAAAQVDIEKSMRLAPGLNEEAAAVASRTSADVAAATGDLETARKRYEQAMAMRQSMGDERSQPSLLEALGDLDTRSGDLARAKSELQDSLAGYRRYRDVGGVAMCLRDLGTIATRQGQFAEAAGDFREALRGIHGRNAFDMEHDIEARQALLLVKQGRSAEARRMLESCLAYWTRRGHPRWIATTTQQFAVFEASVGHAQAGKKLFRDAAARYEKVGDRFDAAECVQAATGGIDGRPERVGLSVPRPSRPVRQEKPLLVVDFESTPDGESPAGFMRQGSCEVTSREAHWGKKCLQMDPAERGPRRIVLKGDLVKQIGPSHWGRLYLKVRVPTPVPTVPAGKTFAVIHSTIVEGAGTSPLHNDPIWVRLADTCTGPDGGLQWLYNVWVTPRPEFGKGSPFKYKFTGDWMLVEWHVDSSTQSYELFIDGKEIPEVRLHNGAGNYSGTEIPPFFDTLAFGWNNYQSAGEGFTAWIDDIAIAHERIGDKNLSKS